MASSAHSVGPNFRAGLLKTPGLRLADALPRDTTDYAEILCGDGVPSGAYGRASGTTLVYLRKDAASALTALYLSDNGGTNWYAVNAGSTAAADVLQGVTGTTATFYVSMVDNLADAFSLREGANKYLVAVTTDGSESVDVYKSLRADTIKGRTGTTGTFSLSLVDNLVDAFTIKEGSNQYLAFKTTDGAEAVQVLQRLLVTDGVSGGTSRVVGGVAYSNTALSTTISGGSGGQSFDISYAVPASTLKAGSVVKVRGQVKAINQNATDTFQVTVRIGSQTVAQSSAVDIAPNDRCSFDVSLETFAAPGASVTCVYHGRAGWTTSGAVQTFSANSGSLATNGSLTVDVQITYGSSSASNQAALEMFYVEIT